SAKRTAEGRPALSGDHFLTWPLDEHGLFAEWAPVASRDWRAAFRCAAAAVIVTLTGLGCCLIARPRLLAGLSSARRFASPAPHPSRPAGSREQHDAGGRSQDKPRRRGRGSDERLEFP